MKRASAYSFFVQASLFFGSSLLSSLFSCQVMRNECRMDAERLYSGAPCVARLLVSLGIGMVSLAPGLGD